MRFPFRSLPTVLVAALAIGVVACNQEASIPVDPGQSTGLTLSGKGKKSQSLEAQLLDLMANTNAALASDGAAFRLGKIEAISGNPDEAGITVLWKNVGNKQLAHDFVANRALDTTLLAQQRALVQRALDRVVQMLQLDRLREIVEHALRHGFRRRGRVVDGRQHDDAEIGVRIEGRRHDLHAR